jgi:hypothetical protein
MTMVGVIGVIFEVNCPLKVVPDKSDRFVAEYVRGVDIVLITPGGSHAAIEVHRKADRVDGLARNKTNLLTPGRQY